MIHFAITPPYSYRMINDPEDLMPGELLSETPPPDPPRPSPFDAYCLTIADSVSAWLSSYVRTTYGYDNIISACSYKGDKDAKYNAEATAASAWRSDCFTALYAALPTYQSLPRDQWPTLEYVTANLPQPSAYQWEPING